MNIDVMIEDLVIESVDLKESSIAEIYLGVKEEEDE